MGATKRRAVSCLGGRPVAHAQTATDTQPRAVAAGPTNLDYRVLRASQVVGLDVHDMQGKDIGEVDEVVIDMARQRVHYTRLEVDAGWSTPDCRVAVPLGAFDLRDGANASTLGDDRARLDRN